MLAARNTRTCARARRRIARIRRADWAPCPRPSLCRRPARTDRRSRSRTRRSATPAKACATSAGTCEFIAQVSDRSPSAPNLRPAMNTMFGIFGSALIAASSSRSQLMVSTPRACSQSLTRGIAEAGDADDAALRHGGLGKARQRRPHLAGDAEDHDVAVDLAEIVDQRLARAAQQFVERCDIGNRLRQGVARQQHVLSSSSYCSRMSRTTNIRSRPSTRP